VHPISGFSWGNTKSLKTMPEAEGIDVLARLKGFREKYYSANVMQLVLLGHEPLDELEAMTRFILHSRCLSCTAPYFIMRICNVRQCGMQ